MPGGGERVPVGVTIEQVIAAFARVADDSKTGGGADLFSSDKLSALMCSVIWVNGGEGDDLGCTQVSWRSSRAHKL